MLEKFFSIKNQGVHRVITVFGIKIKFGSNKRRMLELIGQSDEFREKLNELTTIINDVKNNSQKNTAALREETEKIKEDFFYYMLYTMPFYNPKDLRSQMEDKLKITCSVDFNGSDELADLKYLFPNAVVKGFPEREADCDIGILWGTRYWGYHYEFLKFMLLQNKPVYVFEDGFLKSIASPHDHQADSKYRHSVSFTINSKIQYCDSTAQSELEKLLNDKTLVITDEQKQRARNCIDKIIQNNLTKYNHQPIYEPKIGRNGVKKVLVVDQSYGDMSIVKGLADENTFKTMLECAVKENPDADIIVKTHPDTLLGSAKGYYIGLAAHDNIYTMKDPINPISLLKYVDKVYVCTSQMGFEGLMCGKEVHTFGTAFYSGYGLTVDRQECKRRTNKRTLEEFFYIAYIMYSYYVNPDRHCRCEIEEAMDYLLKLRDEYFLSKKGI